MEKITFTPEEGGDIEFYIMEQTKINGINYLLVTEEEDGDCDAYILKELSQGEDEDSTYEMVESEEELEYMSRIFGEILDDVDVMV